MPRQYGFGGGLIEDRESDVKIETTAGAKKINGVFGLRELIAAALS
jgi:hypothetical protein